MNEKEFEFGEVFWTAAEDFCSCDDETDSHPEAEANPKDFEDWKDAKPQDSDTAVCEFRNEMNFSNNRPQPQPHQRQCQTQSQAQTSSQSNDRTESKPRVAFPKRFYKVARFTANVEGLAKPYRKNDDYGINFESLGTTTREDQDQFSSTCCNMPRCTIVHDPGTTCQRKAEDNPTSMATFKAESTVGSTVPVSNDMSRWLIRPSTGLPTHHQQTQTVPEYLKQEKEVKDTLTPMKESFEGPTMKQVDNSVVRHKSFGNQKETCSAACQTIGKFDAYDRYIDHIRQYCPSHSVKEKPRYKTDDAMGRPEHSKQDETWEEMGCTSVESGTSILRNNDHTSLSDQTKCVRFSAFDELKIKENDSLTKLQANIQIQPSSEKKATTCDTEEDSCPRLKDATRNSTSVLDTQQLFYDMWLKKKFCDVTINVGGRHFDAHRVILAASSSYFEWLFLNTSTTAEDKSRFFVVINDISAETFDSVLHFIYTSRVNVQVGQVYKLLRASLAFSIKPLTDAIQEFLLNSWKDNCIDAFCVAQATGLNDLNDAVIKHIQTNFLDVATTEQFATCPAEHASVILADENLIVNEEIDILQAILLRLRHQTGKTGSNLRLLRHVHFESIPQKSLEMFIQAVSITNCHETVRRYLQDARKRTSHFVPEQLHFNPPVARKHIWRVASRQEAGVGKSYDSVMPVQTMASKVDGRCSVPKNQQEVSAGKLYKGLFSHINRRWPEKVQQASPRPCINRNPAVVTICRHCPSRQECEKSAQNLTLPSSAKNAITGSLGTQFPSYHELDTGAISVSVSTQEMVHGIEEFPHALTKTGTSDYDSMQEPRSPITDCGHACLVILGGVTSNGLDSPVETVMIRDIDKGGDWKEATDLPVPMHHHSVCFVHNSIYVGGGHASTERNDDRLSPSALFYTFDLLDGRWYRLADMHKARIFHQSVALFGQIYVVGGQGEDGRALSSVERYSPYTNSWRATAPLSFPRYAAAVAVYNFRLWIAGGVTGHVMPTYSANYMSAEANKATIATVVTPVVEYYSAHDNSWTKVSDLPRPRCHAALLRVNNRLYIVGGFGSTRPMTSRNTSTSTIDYLDDVSNTWHYVTEIEEGNYSKNTVTMGSKIFIVGTSSPGVESSTLTTMAFDTLTKEWTNHRSNFDYPPACIGNACCVVPMSPNYIWLEK